MKKKFIFSLLIFATLSFAFIVANAQVNFRENVNGFTLSLPVKTKTCVLLAEKGDTIKSIAEMYEVSAVVLAKLNGLLVTTRLPEGREVIMFYKDNNFPSTCVASEKTNKYEIVRATLGDTIESLSCRYNVSPNEVAEINKLSVNSRLAFAQKVKIPTEQNYKCVNQLYARIFLNKMLSNKFK